MLKIKSFFLFLTIGITNIYSQGSDTLITQKFNLDEVVVTATRTPKRLAQSPVITQIITRKQIENRGLSDIKAFLEQEIPGLQFRQVGFGTSISLQGLDAKHILFLVDGERIAGETGNNIDYARLDLSNVERVEIVQGASSALYGSQAMGGVINIITKNVTNKLNIDIGGRWEEINQRNYKNILADDAYSVFKKNADKPNANANLGVGWRWKNVRLQTNVALKSADAYQLFDTDSVTKYFPSHHITIAENKNETPTNVSGYGSINATQKISYTPINNLTLTANGKFYAMNKYDLVMDNKYERNKAYAHGATAQYKFSEKSDLSISYYFDNYARYNRYELLPDKSDLIYRNSLFQPRAQYNIALQKHQLTSGIEMLYENLHTDKFEALIYQTKSQKSGTLFLQDDWQLKQNINITGGVRADWHSAYGLHLSPKLSAMFKIFPFTFRFNYAGGYRSPSLKELYMNWDHLGMFMIYGNKELRPETNQYLSLSTEYVSEYIYAVATGYANFFTDKIEGIWAADQKELHYKNTASAALSGANINVRVNPVKNLNLTTSINYSHRSDIKGVRLNTESPLSGTVRLEYTLTKGKYSTIFNFSGSILSKKKYDVMDKITVNGAEIEAYYTAQSPAYSVWNAVVTQRFGKWAIVSAGIDNLFDYKAKIINFNSYTQPGRKFFITMNFTFNK